MCELLLTLRQVLDLLLPSLGFCRALVVRLLQLLDLQVDHLLALRDSRLERRQPLLLLERAVELREPLRDLALTLLELGLGGGQRRGAPVERGGLPCDVLLEPHLAAGDLDLLVQRRAQILLARQRRVQLGTQQLDVGRRRVGSGDRLAGRARFFVLACELGPQPRPEATFRLAVVCSHRRPGL